MAVKLEDGLKALREAAEQAPAIQVELDESYLRGIAAVEAMPGNRTGSDKTWVVDLIASSERHFARATRLR
jgi:hypothetical protein